MKKVLTLLPLTALCVNSMQAQQKKEYTNFSDTTFSIQEVVVQTAKRNIPQVTKLNVPMKYPEAAWNYGASAISRKPCALCLVCACRPVTGHSSNCRYVVSTIPY